MKSYRIFSKYPHVLIINRIDRKEPIQLLHKQEHTFHSSGEYKMYQKSISAFIASGKLGLEEIDGSVSKPQEETHIDEVEINEDEVEREVAEAEEAEEEAREEREEADHAVLLKEKKKEYNKMVREYKKIPMNQKDHKKEVKSKIEALKEEIASLGG